MKERIASLLSELVAHRSLHTDDEWMDLGLAGKVLWGLEAFLGRASTF
jgi:hypothetical protein